MRSRTQLEELVAKLQDEKVAAEEKMKSEMQRCEYVMKRNHFLKKLMLTNNCFAVL